MKKTFSNDLKDSIFLSNDSETSSQVKQLLLKNDPLATLKMVQQKIEIFELNKNIGDNLSISFINEFRILLNKLEELDFSGQKLITKIECLKRSEELINEYDITNKEEGNDHFECNQKKYKNKNTELVENEKKKSSDTKQKIFETEKTDENLKKTQIFLYNSKTVKKDKKADNVGDILEEFEKTIKKLKTPKTTYSQKEYEKEIFKTFENLNNDLKKFLKEKTKKTENENENKKDYEEFKSLVNILFFNISKKNENVFTKFEFIQQLKMEFLKICDKFEQDTKKFKNLFLEIRRFHTLLSVITENFCYQSQIY